ncbi:MAG TPA: IS21-like element helper ATPase IstB [Thermoanaerobaculia bacterium]|nr:IS21-like element helper ATPase IstB [Thermoanaerobaculia bacterium]
MSELLSPELRAVLRRLKLSPMSETLPERLRLARERALPYQDFLELVLAEECERRNQLAVSQRASKAHLDPALTLESWDDSAKVTLDRQLLAELACARFLEAHHNVLILGPVGVGKTHLASGLGHIACRRGHSVLFTRTEGILKQLRAGRLDHSFEREMRRFLAVDLLILDDFGLDTLDPTESRDVYEVLVERHQRHSTIVTSNRAPEEWLSTMSDPLRAQSAIDRLTNAAYELVLDGESYRRRQKPGLKKQQP